MKNTFYKSLSDYELFELFKETPFKRKPFRHQLCSIAFALDNNRVMFLHDIGTGKTLTALYSILMWKTKKTLVVCPTSVVRTWVEEIERYTPFKYELLLGTTKERKQKLSKQADIYIINYEGLKWLFATKQKIKVKGKLQNKFVLDWDEIKKYTFDCVLADEFHRFKDSRTIQTKIAVSLSAKSDYVIMMSGTPIVNNELDIFSEFLVLDSGETFGTNAYKFLNTYFKQDWWGNWTIKGEKERQQILSLMEPKVIRYSKEECVDLPDKTYEVRWVTQSKEQGELTDKILEGIRVDLENGSLKPQNALLRTNKLAQITGGFLITNKKMNKLKTNPKINELEECLKEIKGKVIVFHQYQEEGRKIEALCKKMKIGFASLRGEIKNKEKEYKKFKEDVNIKVLVSHPLSAGEGLNFQNASTIIFFSNSYSNVARQQCEGRIYRAGQQNKCTFIDIIMKGTIDERILEAQRGKKDISDSLLSWLKIRKL